MTRHLLGRLSLAAVLALAFAPVSRAKQEPIEVQVVNDPSQALPVSVETAPADEPVLLMLSLFDATFSGSAAPVTTITRVCVGATPECEGAGGSYVVPAGTTLVIESVAVIARTPQVPTAMSATVDLLVPGASGGFGFDLGQADRSLSTSISYSWAKTYPVTLRAPAGTTVRGGAVWNTVFSGTVEASIVISGRLIEAP